ncbi:unnamed protein product [Camellia sinensis]
MGIGMYQTPTPRQSHDRSTAQLVSPIARVRTWISASTKEKFFLSSMLLPNDSNYIHLTELYNKYKDKAFEILAFPCNQFLHQEPGTSAEAELFACTRYKAEYPIFHKGLMIGSCVKVESKLLTLLPAVCMVSCNVSPDDYSIIVCLCVNGPRTAPIYKFLKASKGAGRSGFLGPRIKWNFTKFLVDKEGEVIRRYGTTTSVFAIEARHSESIGRGLMDFLCVDLV